MILDQNHTLAVDGAVAFPDWPFTAGVPVPQSQVRETISLTGSTTTSAALIGSPDRPENSP